MKRRIHRHSFPVLLAATAITIGTLAALVPAVQAAEVIVSPLVTQASKTNTDPDKKVFVRCPSGTTATGGGAQIFVQGLGTLPPGQHGRVSITQVIPSRDLSGYAARAQAETGFRFPWHLTAYAICH